LIGVIQFDSRKEKALRRYSFEQVTLRKADGTWYQDKMGLGPHYWNKAVIAFLKGCLIDVRFAVRNCKLHRFIKSEKLFRERNVWTIFIDTGRLMYDLHDVL